MRSTSSWFTWWRTAGVLAVLLMVPLLVAAGRVGAAPAGPRVLSSDVVPDAVRNGTAQATGIHAGSDQLLVLFMLPMRDWAGLNAFLADVSNPRSPNFGHYLSEAEVTARFGPEAD